MEKSIFEILGVQSREDSFTGLLVNALNYDICFQKSFYLDVLKIEHSDGWEAFSRFPVHIYSDSNRRKDCPDIILSNHNERKCIIIENKVFSGEGWEQTIRYSSTEFRNALESKLNYKISEIHYFYLTLDGTSPDSPQFKPISYEKIKQCKYSNEESSNYAILIADFFTLLNDYYSNNPPCNNEGVFKYLKRNKGLINPYRNFQVLSHSIFGKLADYNIDLGITSNRGSGFIPICLVSKSNWISSEYPIAKTGYKCFDIHFELQWDTREDKENITFYIHYHTNPYMTQKEISGNNIPWEFINSYEKRRRELFDYLCNTGLPIWQLSITPLRIGYMTFKNDINFIELKEKLLESVSITSAHIDKFLEE